MAGLIHPEDIGLWTEWSRSRRPVRRAKHAVTDTARALRRRLPGGAPAGEAAPAWTLHSRGAEGEEAPGRRLLIAVDSATPTSRASLLSGLLYHRAAVDVLAPAGIVPPEISGSGWTARPLDAPEAAAGPGTGAIVSIGQHLAAGAAAHRLARRHGIPEFVVQHGALTPFAPPLPHGATLLAWSAADAAFWRSSREDVAGIDVGSQLLWQAAHEPSAGQDSSAAHGPLAAQEPSAADDGSAAEESSAVPDPERPLFLGQLHGAELPRRITGGAATRFCRDHHGLYRPHPAETDVLSRAQHRLWQRRGIEFAPTDVPLRALPNPVVSVFSTGVLEAAARGSRAWVYAPGAPRWVHELWDRYDMRRVGGDPTPSPVGDAEEPAARIARLLEEAL